MSINAEAIAVQPWRLPVSEFIALAKPRLNVLVVASAAVAIRFARRRDLSGARWLFSASLLYLPLLWAALLINCVQGA